VNAYALGLAAIHAHRYQAAELQAAFRACLKANLRLVTSSMEPEVVLSQLLVRIISEGAR
jgi:DNA polymerase-3 subunit delta